jgi:hypothetical protein
MSPTCFDVLWVPRWKGITCPAEEFADPPSLGWTMTRVAVMVVPLVVPRTRTGSPVVTALAEVELVPDSYVVEDASLTFTACPADVVTVNPEADALVTVPVVPPAAGPDRALDVPPPDPAPPELALDPPVPGKLGPGVPLAAGVEDVASATDSATTAHTSAAFMHYARRCPPLLQSCCGTPVSEP